MTEAESEESERFTKMITVLSVSHRSNQQNKNSKHAAQFWADSFAAIQQLTTFIESIFKTKSIPVFFVMGKKFQVSVSIYFPFLSLSEERKEKIKMALGQVEGNC